MGQNITSHLWLDKTYDETLSLLEEAKAYNADIFPGQIRDFLPIKKMEATKESLRVTTRLSHTIAWLMNEKAIINDELTRREVESMYPPLQDEEICTFPSEKTKHQYPNGLVVLLDKSYDLFMRATRLENMLREEPMMQERKFFR